MSCRALSCQEGDANSEGSRASFLPETCPIPANIGEKNTIPGPVQDAVPLPQRWQTLCGVAHGNAEAFPPRYAFSCCQLPKESMFVWGGGCTEGSGKGFPEDSSAPGLEAMPAGSICRAGMEEVGGAQQSCNLSSPKHGPIPWGCSSTHAGGWAWGLHGTGLSGTDSMPRVGDGAGGCWLKHRGIQM